MRIAAILAALAAAASTTACARGEAMNAGPKASRDFAVGDFSKVEAAGAYLVEVRTGGAPSVRATGPKNVIDRMDVAVDGDTLKIRPDKKFGKVRWTGGDRVVVAINVPALRGATIAGASDIRIDKASGDTFDGLIGGAGSMDLGQVSVGTLAVKIAGSGDVTGKGRAERADYDIAGSGNIAAASIASRQADIKIAGSGEVAANVSDSANVRIMGSGDITITGGAKCSVKKMGAGNVSCS